MKKLGLIVIVLIVVLGSLGISYASWTQGLNIGGSVVAATAPSVTTSNATSIGTTTATLNGNLSVVGGKSPVTVWFKYSTSATTPDELSGTWYPADSPVSGSLSIPGNFSLAISGLSSSTTYHFRTKAVGYWTKYGEDVIFTTLAPSNQAEFTAAGLASQTGGYSTTVSIPSGSQSIITVSIVTNNSQDYSATISYTIHNKTGSPIKVSGTQSSNWSGLPAATYTGPLLGTTTLAANGSGSGTIVISYPKGGRPNGTFNTTFGYTVIP
jgi:hypothetical protein